MNTNQASHLKGFTILELLVVITIIGILSAVVLVSLGVSKEKGRDAGRKSQTQEILKALELYFSDNAGYPTHLDGAEGPLNRIDSTFYGTNTYLNRLPEEAGSHFYYCVSTDRKTILLAVNTDEDRDGSDWCSITRGQGSTGCDLWYASNAPDSCALRF